MIGPLVIRLPGKPMAEKRPRMRVIAPPGRKPFASVYPDPESKNWRLWAKSEMQRAVELAGHDLPLFSSGPVYLQVQFIWQLTKSLERKTLPVPASYRDKKPDMDNCLKAVMDAANGILYSDDSQVAKGSIEKVVAAQGDAPKVIIAVSKLGAYP